MKIHFREKYGTKGEEILYVTPAGNFTAECIRMEFSIDCGRRIA